MSNAALIPLSNVLREVFNPGAVFDLTYRKTDGVFGEKKECMTTPSNSPLTERRKMSRSGLLSLMIKDTHGKPHGKPFNLYIDLLLTFNGQQIDHES